MRKFVIGIVWLVLLMVSAMQIQRTQVVTDVSSFLPGPANAQQRLMSSQLRDGLSTRIVVIGLRLELPTGRVPSPDQKAALVAASRSLREQLIEKKVFAWVVNGDIDAHALDRQRLFNARYLLSPEVNAGRFTTESLRDAFRQLELELVSMRGSAIKSIVGADPTLESLHLLERASEQMAPLASEGVWLSKDGRSAILLMETRAKGDDIPQLRAGIDMARTTAQGVLRAWTGGAPVPAIDFAGAGYFNVMSHDAIGKDAEQLSLMAIVLVAALLLWSLRSPRLLMLAVVPVATGALAGFASVGWYYGTIHGITIAFGVTLIGEAVDYAIYTFVQRDESGRHSRAFWRQLALATLTSLIGFAAMYFSGFQGLQQLGVFSMVGLITAYACARWLLPLWLPANNAGIKGGNFSRLADLTAWMRRMRWPLILVTVLAASLVVARQDRLWNDSLDSLSSSTAQEAARDQSYRDDIGVPDMRTMIAVRGATLDQALSRSEAVGRELEGMIREGQLRSYDSPAVLMPSQALQSARRAALPDAEQLRSRSLDALAGGRFKPQVFEAFFADVSRSKTMPPIDLAYYENTVVGRWLESQIVRSDDGVSVLILMHGLKPDARVAARLTAANLPGVGLIDLKRDVELLVADYRRQAMQAALIGSLVIMALLVVQLRRARAIVSMALTLVATVVVTAAIVLLLKGQLTVFNLVALLLVAGVASNYTLFFSTLSSDPQERQRASLSVVLAAASTFIAFAMLAGSSTPVLAMIGLTVALGAAIGLLASMVFSPG